MTGMVSEAVTEYRVYQQLDPSLGPEQSLAKTSG